MRDAWIDFNSVHSGRVTTLLKNVAGPAEIGRELTVGDHEGNLCQAVIVGVDDQLVDLAIQPDTFVAAGDVRDPQTG